MFRAIACALVLAAGASVRAGELDREPTTSEKSAPVVATASGSELDRESPQSAHGWRWGGPYYGAGWGWGGYYYPARVSYFNFGYAPAFYSYYSYRPYGFYGGFGYAYRPYFPAYYSPFGYSYWW